MSPENNKRILPPRKYQEKSPKNKTKRKLDFDDNDQLKAGK